MRTIVFFIFLCMCASTVPARSQSFRLKTYTTKDGLPSSYTLGFLQDRKGYLWISTVNGLARFDGWEFHNYNCIDGLPNAFAGTSFLDHEGRLWVSTRNGAGEFRGNRFVAFPLSDSTVVFDVLGFFETDQKKIWITTNVGIYEFNNESWNKIQLFPGYDNHSCRNVIQTASGLLINYGNVIFLRTHSGQFQQLTPLQGPEYYYLNLLSSGGELFCTSIDRMYKFVKEQLVRMPGIAGTLKGLYALFRDSKKRSWIFREAQGLQLLASDNADSLVTVYKKPLINLVSSIGEDAQGNIWVCDFEGLIKITEPGYTVYDSKNIPPINVIRNLINIPQHPMMLNDGTLRFLEFQNSRFAEKKYVLKGMDRLPFGKLIIDNYCVDDKGKTWLSLRGFTLATLEEKAIEVQRSKYASLGPEAFDVMYDNYRKKIVAAVLTQPFPCVLNDSIFVPMSVTNKIRIPGIIRILHQCTDYSILFSTEAGNIYSIDTNNYCKEQLPALRNASNVAYFRNGPSGDVWIAFTGIGLSRCGWSSDSLVVLQSFTKENGLFNEHLRGMEWDHLGHLWVATLYGVCVLARDASGEYAVTHTFTLSDLDADISELSRLSKDATGNIWLSFPDKLICFYPVKIFSEKKSIPDVQIEDIRLDMRKTDWSMLTPNFDGYLGIPHGLRLAYNRNNIAIYFKAVSASGTGGAQYSYQLNGTSGNWSAPSSANFVSFVRMPPGKYQFYVKAKLPGGQWSQPASFKFEIKKPFWSTWWFRLLLLLLASIFIITVFRNRLHQIRTKTFIKNQMLELEMKALKAQMNPHFIYNALNSIQALIAENHAKEAGKYISQFAKLLRQVLEQSDNNVITLEKELQTAGLYVSLESLRLGIGPVFEIKVDAGIQPANEKIPPLILQPFIENSLWHGLSNRDGEKKILLHISGDDDWLFCTIEDNGIGRAAAVKATSDRESHSSRGIAITRQRLMDVNDDGQKDPVLYEDLYDKQGRPAGTRATLRVRRTS